MIYLKQSTASQEIPLGRFVDSTDGNTEETGLSIANTDIKLWKTGATTLASKNSGGATHIANGEYYCVLDATDTNTLGPMKVAVHVSGALPVQVWCCVLAANVYDALIGGSDLLEVNATEIEGSDATNQIRDAVVDDATRIDASALNTLSSHDPGEAIMGATDLGTGAGLTSLASATNLAAVKSVVDDVQAKTDNLPSDPADESLIIAATDALASAIATVDGNVDAIKVVTDKLDDTLEDQGSGTYGFTEEALQAAPGGGGGSTTDWDATERAQIRYRLGIDGTASAPSSNVPQLGEQTLTSAYDAAKDAASQTSVDDLPTNAELATALTGMSTFDPATDEVKLTVDYDAAKTAAQAGDAMTLEAGAVDATALDSSAVAEIQSGLSTLDAAGVRTAIGLASDNLDEQLGALPTASENASAVLSAANSTPIRADLRKVNNVTITGTGTEGDEWGPA